MKIALTGAAGFIGRCFCKEPALARHELILHCLNAEQAAILRENEGGKTQIVAFDLAEAGDEVFARMGSPDMVIHLAWGGLNNFQSPEHMTKEMPLHFNFLNRLIRGGLRRLVVIGTCFEYGLQNGEMDEEQYCHPATWYGLAKYSLLRQLEFLRTQVPFELLWPRLFYIYGEGQSANSIYPQLMRAIASGEPEFRMSAGEQIRDYISIEDLVGKLCRLSLSSHTGVVNVCSGKPISLRRQVENWAAEKQSPIRLRLGHYPYRDFEPFAFWGKTKKLQEYLEQ